MFYADLRTRNVALGCNEFERVKFISRFGGMRLTKWSIRDEWHGGVHGRISQGSPSVLQLWASRQLPRCVSSGTPALGLDDGHHFAFWDNHWVWWEIALFKVAYKAVKNITSSRLCLYQNRKYSCHPNYGMEYTAAKKSFKMRQTTDRVTGGTLL